MQLSWNLSLFFNCEIFFLRSKSLCCSVHRVFSGTLSGMLVPSLTPSWSVENIRGRGTVDV